LYSFSRFGNDPVSQGTVIPFRETFTLYLQYTENVTVLVEQGFKVSLSFRDDDIRGEKEFAELFAGCRKMGAGNVGAVVHYFGDGSNTGFQFFFSGSPVDD